MRMSSTSRKGTTLVSVRHRVLLLLALATGLTGFWSSGSGTPTSAQSTGSTPVAAQSQPSFEESSPLVAWRIDIAQIPQPKKGCFTATYPSKEWREVPCTSTPPYPQPPRRGPRPRIVGNRDDHAPRCECARDRPMPAVADDDVAARHRALIGEPVDDPRVHRARRLVQPGRTEVMGAA